MRVYLPWLYVLIAVIRNFEYLPVRVPVRCDETEATDNAHRLVVGTFVLQFGRLLSLLAVALLIAEVISTYSDVIHLVLFHDRDFVWVNLWRRQNAGYKRPDDEDLPRIRATLKSFCSPDGLCRDNRITLHFIVRFNDL